MSHRDDLFDYFPASLKGCCICILRGFVACACRTHGFCFDCGGSHRKATCNVSPIIRQKGANRYCYYCLLPRVKDRHSSHGPSTCTIDPDRKLIFAFCWLLSTDFPRRASTIFSTSDNGSGIRRAMKDVNSWIEWGADLYNRGDFATKYCFDSTIPRAAALLLDLVSQVSQGMIEPFQVSVWVYLGVAGIYSHKVRTFVLVVSYDSCDKNISDWHLDDICNIIRSQSHLQNRLCLPPTWWSTQGRY